MKKTYKIEMFHDDKGLHLERKNKGFSPWELLGLLEEVQMDIIKQLAGTIKPTIIKRKVIDTRRQP